MVFPILNRFVILTVVFEQKENTFFISYPSISFEIILTDKNKFYSEVIVLH